MALMRRSPGGQSDRLLGLVEALGEVYPESKWQRCVVHFYRNVFTVTPSGKKRAAADMLKAIHASEDIEVAGNETQQGCGHNRTGSRRDVQLL